MTDYDEDVLARGQTLNVRLTPERQRKLDLYVKRNKLSHTRKEAIEAIIDGIVEGRSLVNATPPAGRSVGMVHAASGASAGARGVNLRQVREAIRAGIEEEGTFADAVFRSAGMPLFDRITSVRRIGTDVILDAKDQNRRPLQLVLTCTIDDRSFHQKAWRHRDLVDAQAYPGLVGKVVLLAPRVYFDKTCLSEFPDEWTFDYLLRFASPPLVEVLEEAIDRAEEAFRFADPPACRRWSFQRTANHHPRVD